jgi:hypothetical protein
MYVARQGLFVRRTDDDDSRIYLTPSPLPKSLSLIERDFTEVTVRRGRALLGLARQRGWGTKPLRIGRGWGKISDGGRNILSI